MTAKRRLTDFTPDARNANRGTERGLRMLDDSLRKHGAGRSILVDKNNKVIAGNKTLERAVDIGLVDAVVVPTDGRQLVVVQRTDIDLDTKAGRELALADNRVGQVDLEWDGETLAALAAEGVDLSALWNDDELAALIGASDEPPGATPEQARKTLAERFVVPPFSVLDARQGYWQERKRAWIGLGIQSELGRGAETFATDVARGTPGGMVQGMVATQRVAGRVTADSGGNPLPLDRARNAANGRGEHVVGARQQADMRSNVTGASPLPLWATETGTANMATGTSIFDPVLCELAYRWFSPPDGAVLDPFAGGSVRGIVAAQLGRRYTGIDLRSEQIAANEAQWQAIGGKCAPRWITGNSLQVNELAPGAYDFVFSCPPYGDLEVYGDNPADLSYVAAQDYAAFVAQYRDIIARSVAMLADNRFACFVVGDIRDKRGMYRNFVSDTIAAFQDAGSALYNEAILVTSAGSLPIRVGKQFSSSRKLGKTHQNVLVFIKGNPREAVRACGDVTVDVPDEEA